MKNNRLNCLTAEKKKIVQLLKRAVALNQKPLAQILKTPAYSL